MSRSVRYIACMVLASRRAGQRSTARRRCQIDDAASIDACAQPARVRRRPGDVARVQTIGLGRWIDQQLHPERIANARSTRSSRVSTTLELDAVTIAREYLMPRRAGASRAAAVARMRRADDRRRTAQRRIFQALSEAKLLRAVYSERQLEEVLVDFWFNHFNVFARKGQTGIYVGEYERDAIRPHVLGKFRDLLGPPPRARRCSSISTTGQSVDAERAGRRRSIGKRARGLNENYARELLELHTLGVDGGYTQQDIVEVARAFTGLDHRPARRRRASASRAIMHDRGDKTVLGHTITAGGGIEDGERVLDIVAQHPSTARHIAFKLAQRFVSDTPPPALVDRAASTFQSTRRRPARSRPRHRHLARVLRARGASAKVKTPFEFVASALRATGAEVSQRPCRSSRALADDGHAALPVPAADRVRRHRRGVGVVRRARQPHQLRAWRSSRRRAARCAGRASSAAERHRRRRDAVRRRAEFQKQ